MGTVFQINSQRISGAIVHQAARIINRGGVIVYPTETIYGVGCDAFNEHAIERVFKIKGRPETKPVLVLVRNRTMLKSLVADIPDIGLLLMKQYWPGPLTLIFPAHKNVSTLVTANTGKVGIRIPGNSFCLKLLKEAGTPIVSTSANISGVHQHSSMHLLKQLFVDKVDLIVDSGDPPQSLPSTIIDVCDATIRIVRDGAITKKMLAGVM